jgi:hypothetical protein
LHSRFVILRLDHLLNASWERSLRWSFLRNLSFLLKLLRRYFSRRTYLIRSLVVSLLLRQLNLLGSLGTWWCHIILGLDWRILVFFFATSVWRTSLTNYLSFRPVLNSCSCLEIILGHEIPWMTSRCINKFLIRFGLFRLLQTSKLINLIDSLRSWVSRRSTFGLLALIIFIISGLIGQNVLVH